MLWKHPTYMSSTYYDNYCFTYHPNATSAWDVRSSTINNKTPWKCPWISLLLGPQIYGSWIETKTVPAQREPGLLRSLPGYPTIDHQAYKIHWPDQDILNTHLTKQKVLCLSIIKQNHVQGISGNFQNIPVSFQKNFFASNGKYWVTLWTQTLRNLINSLPRSWSMLIAKLIWRMTVPSICLSVSTLVLSPSSRSSL